MIPNSPSPGCNGDETAVSGAGRDSTPAPSTGSAELTDAGGPSDATIVRAAPPAAAAGGKTGEADANNFGRYELLGEIARGGMGVVYRARQPGLDRVVALKMVLGTGTDRDAAKRFLQEARAAAALDHPNVVPIYDTGEIDGRPYFTMALVDGPNLRGYAEGRGTLPLPEVVALFAQVVEGVAHAHKHGIIHRDLKPANVLMDRDGRPRVTDFGLAKRAAGDSQLTATGQVVGTPQYMAPEQARDSKDVGPPADVYSLGAILYFLLTGRPPFHGESFADLLIKVLSDPPTAPRQLRPDVPADLEALCLRCLAKQPADRFADADALAVALAPIVARYHLSSGSRTALSARTHAPPAPSAGTVPDLSAVIASGTVRTSSGSVAPAAPAGGSRDRRPVIFGLAALVVVLVALAGYLATRDTRPPDRATHEPPANPTPPAVPGPAPVPPAPGAKDANEFAWPAPSRADFGLKLELRAPAAKEDADGKLVLVADTPLEIHLTAEKDCRVSVWVLDASGEVTRLFPNKYEDDDRLVAGQTRVLPGKDGGTYQTTPTEGAEDRLRVIATTGDRPAFPDGVHKNQFVAYSAPADRERLAATVRGIVLKKPDAPGSPASVTEAERRFRVQK